MRRPLRLLLNSATGVVDRRQGRRMHAARIYGSKSKMTVAIYEGDNAEENWREAVSQYSNFRHPNLVQTTLWIRLSTRTLCVELAPDYEYDGLRFARAETTHDFLLDASQVSKLIVSMSLQHYYQICAIQPSWFNTYWLQIPKHSAVALGAVNCLLEPNYEDTVEVAFSLDFLAGDWGWNDGDTSGITLENHWIRITSADVDASYWRTIMTYFALNPSTGAWLSQANHIFKSLKITSNYEKY
ncbi:hypothetical protein B0H17DRAFT_1231945, partial [Mycena rosella]